MFAIKATAFPDGAPLQGEVLGLPTNIRLGWKGLKGKNTLAYCEHSKFTNLKSFMTFGSGSINCLCSKPGSNYLTIEMLVSKNNAMTLSIMTLSIMILNIMTFSIMTFRL